jgi:hypothetical protein
MLVKVSPAATVYIVAPPLMTVAASSAALTHVAYRPMTAASVSTGTRTFMASSLWT